MRNPFNFEPEPLRGDTTCGCRPREFEMESAALDSEEEFRGGRRVPMRGARLRLRPFRRPLRPPKRPMRPPLGRPKPPCRRPPCPPYRGGWIPWPVLGEPGVYREPDGFDSEPPVGSEYVRWVQACLNQALGLQLPVTGVIGAETRSGVRTFQRRQGLRASGIVGPDTEEALRAACENRDGRRPSTEAEFAATYESGSARGAVGEWAEMELPPRFRLNYDTLVNRMPPQHQRLWERSRCYLLSEWHRAPRKRGGVYLLIFRNPSRRSHIGYVGMTGNLYERMRGYNRDVLALGHDPNNYAFCWYETPQYQRIEQSLRRTLNPTGLVTNQRELEMEQGF